MKYDFYTLCESTDMIFKYDYHKIGVVRGRWSLPNTEDFLKKEGIKIDYSIRNNKVKKEVKSNKYLDKIKLYLKKIRSLV